ncbi:hypothetical protein [Shimia aestuarii]|uniref:hypothetical protein n=1 Tax=Shimia aestuarii TaxID=254406 RepID=UPI001FB36404|nr:hypothetical protein [Shimia aestuarii]
MVLLVVWMEIALGRKPNQELDSIPLGSDETIALSAMQNEAANSLAREIVASRLLAEVFLPTHLAMFAALCVQGKANATQRKKPGKKRSRNWERDHFIICLVEQLVEECGVLATQNNQPSIKSPTPKSAAGIISQEFARHGVHETTPRAIKEVWSNRKKRQVTDIVNGLMDSYSANPINALAYI